MHAVSLWLMTYAVPAFVTGGILHFLSQRDIHRRREALIIHAGLGASILLSHAVLHELGWAFPWRPHLLSLLTFAASVLLSMRVLGVFGVWYALSALLQQLTILSVSFVLLHELPLTLVLLLVVPVFTLGHAGNVQHRHIRVFVISVWGTASIILFNILPDVYLLAALHTLLGTIGIQRSMVYPTAG